MADGYTGWKLFDKVTIVAKKMFAYDYKTSITYDTGNVQGYLVDPTNKKQLEAARNWGTTYKSIYEEVDGKRQFVDSEIIEPDEYTYDNDGFTLELHNSAEGSSQGGKLSFWNCWITAPDGHRFLIGIAADLLLDVLKSSTIVNGVVQDKLMFARCHGGVGMLSKSMDSYKDAVKDECIKKKMSSGKTKKVVPGHIYETMTEQNIYAGKMYQWYEEVRDGQVDYWHKDGKLIGFKRREKPREFILYPSYREGKNKLSDYETWMLSLRDKTPARRDSGKLVELNITMDDIVRKLEEDRIYYYYKNWIENKKTGSKNLNTNYVGLSASDDPNYELPEELRNILHEYGYKVYE